jgi:hypothetical protein
MMNEEPTAGGRDASHSTFNIRHSEFVICGAAVFGKVH